MRMRNTARTIAVVWALLSALGFASALGNSSNVAAGLIHAAPGLITLITVFIAWRWETLGGALLIAEAMAASFYFHVWKGEMAVLLFMILPAVTAGVLFILCGRKRQAGPNCSEA